MGYSVRSWSSAQAGKSTSRPRRSCLTRHRSYPCEQRPIYRATSMPTSARPFTSPFSFYLQTSLSQNLSYGSRSLGSLIPVIRE